MHRRELWQGLAILLGLAIAGALAVLIRGQAGSEWGWYQRIYGEWTRESGSSVEPELQQINVADLNRVDRCTSCHLGVTDPRMVAAPLPLTAHSDLLDSHPPEAFGCTICHGGEGRAVSIAEGHGQTPGQHGRLLPSGLIPSRCFVCHGLDGLPPAETAVVAEGIKVFNEFLCLRCHQIDGAGGSIGPDLSVVASQRNWIEIYAHLLKPDALVPGSTMPDFGLSRSEATALTAFLLTRLDERQGVRVAGYLAERKAEIEAPIPEVTADPGSLLPGYKGRGLFEGLECMVCHQVGLRGGGVGPALTHIARARSASWLEDLLRDPGQAFPEGQMPAYELSEAQVHALSEYLGTLR